MSIHVQVRFMFGFLSVFLFTVALLHQIFPAWRIFHNKHVREFLGEQEAVVYEKRSSLTLAILGIFIAFGAGTPTFFQEKALILFSCIGSFLGLFYQVCLNYKYFGTINGPHMLHKTKYLWLRILVYIIFLFALGTLLLPCEEMNLFTKCLITALAAGAGAKLVNG